MIFEEIVGEEVWRQHWDNWAKVQALMREAQVLAEQINKKVAQAYGAL
jgi:hypothetical protein